MFLIINNFSFQCFDFQSIIHKRCFVNEFFFDFQSIFNDYFLFIFFPPWFFFTLFQCVPDIRIKMQFFLYMHIIFFQFIQLLFHRLFSFFQQFHNIIDRFVFCLLILKNFCKSPIVIPARLKQQIVARRFMCIS